MVVRKSSDNSLIVPRGILSQFAEADCFDVTTEGDAIVLRPRTEDPLRAIQDHIARLGITEQDVEEAVQAYRRGE